MAVLYLNFMIYRRKRYLQTGWNNNKICVFLINGELVRFFTLEKLKLAVFSPLIFILRA